MTSFTHTGSTFEKIVGHDRCRIQSSIHWRKLRIYIAYSSGEIKLWKFQWRHSRIPEVLLKKMFGMIYVEFNSLFTGAYWPYILLIAAEKLIFEHFNDVIRAYRKYFRKRCLQTKCAELDSVLTAINCTSIWRAVIEIFAFKAVFDVISAHFSGTGSAIKPIRKTIFTIHILYTLCKFQLSSPYSRFWKLMWEE